MSPNQGRDSAKYEPFDDAIVGHFLASSDKFSYRNNSQSQAGLGLFAQF